MAGPVIDLHAHVIVPELLREAAPTEEWRPAVSRDDDGIRLELGGKVLRSVVEEFVDIAGILEVQDARGVDVVVVSPFVPLLFAGAPAPVAAERAGLQNDGLRRMVRDHPGRVEALGAVPLQDPDLAARELRALMADGVLRGTEITASVDGVYLGDPRFEPVWAAAAETGAVVFVHPTTSAFDDPVFSDYYLWNCVGNPTEIGVSAAHVVLAGVLDRHPDLKLMFSHGGGTLRALHGRIAHAHRSVPAAGAVALDPAAAIGRLYFDSVVHDEQLLRELVSFAGADHVVLGSDYPFDMGSQDPRRFVEGAGLDPADAAAVLGGTAACLLGLR